MQLIALDVWEKKVGYDDWGWLKRLFNELLTALPHSGVKYIQGADFFEIFTDCSNNYPDLTFIVDNKKILVTGNDYVREVSEDGSVCELAI